MQLALTCVGNTAYPMRLLQLKTKYVGLEASNVKRWKELDSLSILYQALSNLESP